MSNLPPKRSSNFESSPSLSLEFEAALTTAAAAAAGLESEDAPFDFFDRLKSSSEFESLQIEDDYECASLQSDSDDEQEPHI